MSDNKQIDSPDGARIDVDNPALVREWASKLDATPEQIKDAVAAVGDRSADVEMHLKGSHSTTNDDRVRNAGG